MLVFAFQSEIWHSNFTLIRRDEDCLRADFKSEVWSQKNCIETPQILCHVKWHYCLSVKMIEILKWNVHHAGESY